jgi:hypothetical protein
MREEKRGSLMAQPIALGKLWGLQLSARPSAWISSLCLWLLLVILAAWLLRFSLPQALLGGLLALGLHWISELIHQFGHAWVARQTGHPMVGVQFWALLSRSLYPPDEPTLPASVHIRRALGGPVVSLLLTLVAALIIVLARPRGGSLFWWVSWFFLLENLLVFTIGALIPLGFNDGSTLLEWWGKRKGFASK